MSRVKWIKTDKHVYAAIYREHHEAFEVFGSFSNPTPSELSSRPEMLTEWGFKGADQPIIKCVTTWEHGNKEVTEKHEYFIASVHEDDYYG